MRPALIYGDTIKPMALEIVTVHVGEAKIPCPARLRVVRSESYGRSPPLPPEIWEHTPPVAQEMIVAQAAVLAQLRAEVAQLKATVEELAQRLGRNSQQLLPATLGRSTPGAETVRREASGRRPGGQPGHEGQTRALVPVEEVDVVIPVKPVRCRAVSTRCRGGSPARAASGDGDPTGQTGGDGVSVAPVGLPGLWRSDPGGLPVGVPTGGFGPRVQAITALCTGAYHLSKRTTQTRAGRPLWRLDRPGHGREPGAGDGPGLGGAGGRSAGLCASATGGLSGRNRVAGRAAAGLAVDGRHGLGHGLCGAAVAQCQGRPGALGRAVLGVVGDGSLERLYLVPHLATAAVLGASAAGHRSHDRTRGPSREIGEALRAQARQMFQWWHRVREGTLAHASFASYMWPIRQEVERLLEAGQTCGVPKTEGTCREILKLRQALWTFVRHAGVEPTNNAAERAIRPGVLWRKGSFGTQSPEGSRFVEAMMTVVATLKQQHRNVLDYLTAACEAALRGQPAPSLLPTPAHSNSVAPCCITRSPR